MPGGGSALRLYVASSEDVFHSKLGSQGLPPGPPQNLLTLCWRTFEQLPVIATLSHQE